MADDINQGRQAIDQQNVYIRDTLMSIASSYADTLREAVNSAFDSAEAGTLSAVGKDLTRSFTQLAKMSDEFALNQGRITQGILKEKDVAKQLQSIAEKREALDRKMAHARSLGVEFGEEDYRAALSSLDVQERMLKQDQEQLKNIEKKIGLTGKLVGSLSSIPGIGQFIKADEIDQEMRKAALDEGATKFKTMGIAASMVGKQLRAGFTDPAFIISKILDTYLKINKASVDLQHLTGQNAVTAASWNTNYATAVDYLETAAALTKQTGMNAQNIFSSKVIGQAASLKTTMGLTADEAGGLATMSQTSNQNVNELVDNVVATTSAFNGANRAAVSQGAVLREVANTSDSIKLSLGNNPKALTQAAAAATRLGMSLQDVDDIAASLTEFQSSISNELEAELLTGKDLNLEKARELALSNDLVGLGKELFKNSSDIAEFGKMNRIQQEAQAKALGMTRDQLAKVAYQRALEAGMTNEQAALAANVNAEDMKRVAIQENFAKALEKIAGAVAPILDVIGSILSVPWVPQLVLAVGLLQAMAAASKLMAVYEAFKTGQMVAQRGAAMGYNSLLLARQALLSGELAKSVGIAAAWAVANPVQALLGLGVAAAVGAVVYSQMKDGVIDPKKGPVVSGEFGSVQLHPNDQIVAGTNLMGNKSGQSISNAAAGNDTRNEIKQMREENKSLLTALLNKSGNVYMDSNKVGKAHVLGSYKSA